MATPTPPRDPPFAELPREALELYGYSVQVIAAADGRLTREERELLFDDARRLGVAPDVVDAWTRFNWRTETVASVLGKLHPYLDERLARRVLYGAIRIALADDMYAIDERAAIEEAAEILRVSHAEIESLVALVRIEMGVAVLRRGLRLD